MPKPTSILELLNTPAFRRALEGTRAVDDTGAPVLLYHGSPVRGLKRPDPRWANEVPSSTWLSDHPDVANEYRYQREYGEILPGKPGPLLRGFAQMRNPLEEDAGNGIMDALEMSKLVQAAKRLGNDGLIVRNIDDTIGGGQVADSYGIFSPEQFVPLRGLPKLQEPVPYSGLRRFMGQR